MRHEKSYGIIPLVKLNHEWHVLLVQQFHGQHWGFPKGHADKHEAPQEAALRELLEETGLTVSSFLSEETLKEEYFFHREGHLTHKIVIYFLAEISNYSESPAYQAEEISGIKWVPLKEAANFITYKPAKAVVAQALNILG